MTLRDLTKDQIDALQQKCCAEREAFLKHRDMNRLIKDLWDKAFSEGLKAGLATLKPHVPHDDGK